MLPPQMPHPMLDVIGMPLLNEPAFALDWGWRTIMRLTGSRQRQLIDVIVVERVDAAGVAACRRPRRSAVTISRAFWNPLYLKMESTGESFSLEKGWSLPMPVFWHDEEALAFGNRESGEFGDLGGRAGDGGGSAMASASHITACSSFFSSGLTR